MRTAGDTAVEFHILSFEGPDPYARAGGIASRISGLAETLAAAGFRTHIWFVGDPDLPGHEKHGGLELHRWCQWISRYHPGGVYDGEEGKRSDYVSSLPPRLVNEYLKPHIERGGRAIVLGEEWQTADAVVHIDWLLRGAGLRGSVEIRWNANNVFGFERIDWGGLRAASGITTVSRYMRQLMLRYGVDAHVIPNGLPPTAFEPTDISAVTAMREHLRGRLVLSKVARWDPDKRWLLAIDAVAELKRQGHRPLLVARGGVEAHGVEVMARAAASGLRIAERKQSGSGVAALIASLHHTGDADVISLRAAMSPAACKALYCASDTVLANSAHEPFGLVGLEAMAARGLVCTGSTGEDYAVANWNCLVSQGNDARELARRIALVHQRPTAAEYLRGRGRMTAERYAWERVVSQNLLPHLKE
jgi:glycosyltransferase involved in cell wall biosynthesis